MDRDKAKKILLFCRDIDGEIAMKKRVLQDYEETYCTANGGGVFDGMPRGKNNKTTSPTETTALNIPDSASSAMRGLRAEIEKLSALQTAILKELGKLPLAQKNILYWFYIKGHQWSQVMEQVHYSGTQCKRMRTRGLDNLAKLFAKSGLIKNFDYF